MIIKRKFIDEDVCFDFMYTLERRNYANNTNSANSDNINTNGNSGVSSNNNVFVSNDNARQRKIADNIETTTMYMNEIPILVVEKNLTKKTQTTKQLDELGNVLEIKIERI